MEQKLEDFEVEVEGEVEVEVEGEVEVDVVDF